MVIFKFQIGQKVILTGEHQCAGHVGIVTRRVANRRRVGANIKNNPKYMIDLIDPSDEDDGITYAGEEYMREYGYYPNVESWLKESK